METARDRLGIPIVLRPEDLSSEKLDELSGEQSIAALSAPSGAAAKGVMRHHTAGSNPITNRIRKNLSFVDRGNSD